MPLLCDAALGISQHHDGWGYVIGGVGAPHGMTLMEGQAFVRSPSVTERSSSSVPRCTVIVTVSPTLYS